MDKEAVGKYRKKPVVVEAMQLPSDSAGFWEVYHWMRDDVAEWDDQPFRIRIRTLEGEMWATEGDWIIKGVKGEFYPCKPDIFGATYEPAQQPAAQAAGLTDVVALLQEIRPQFGAPGTRDVDVRAQQKRIDCALGILAQAAPSAVGTEWQEISTAPWSDDLIWLMKGDSIDGPKRIEHDDYDRYTHWAPCEPPNLAASKEA